MKPPVMCFKTKDYRDFIENVESNQDKSLFDLPFFMVPREEVEEDENYLQIIPYISFIFTSKDNTDIKFLMYKRGTSGGEGRLHNQYSLGFGGHIDEVPDIETFNGDVSAAVTDAVLKSIVREIKEELQFDLNKIESLNLYDHIHNKTSLIHIYDSENKVDRVHLGLASTFTFSLDTYNVTIEQLKEIENFATEDCIEDLQLIDLLKLVELINNTNENNQNDKLESWSVHVAMNAINELILNREDVDYTDDLINN